VIERLATPKVALRIVRRDVLIFGERTGARDTGSAPLTALPIEIRASTAGQAAVAAALAAALEQRVPAPPPDRRVVVVLPGAPDEAATVGAATPIRQVWMADAVARIARDAALQRTSSRVPGGLEGARAPTFVVVAAAADGRPLITAASLTDRLLLVSGAAESAVVTAQLLRATANSLAPPDDLGRLEVVPIADRQLQAWARPAPPVAVPRVEALDGDDRRWLWAAALGLLLIETRLRRARRTRTGLTAVEAARVA